MMALRFLLHLLIIGLASCGGSTYAMSPDDPCPLTSKDRVWSAACFDATETGRKIKKSHRKKVVFDRKGFAAIVIAAPPELIAVSRRGMVVAVNRARLGGFDFEPSDDEIARFGYLAGATAETSKFICGFYRRKPFAVLVPPVYDECDSFKKGAALVCMGCADHCPGGDCHENNWAGGQGLVINEKNEVLRKVALPSIPLCSGDKDKASEEKPCRPRPPDPFAEVK
jgi:hypothetical protein